MSYWNSFIHSSSYLCFLFKIRGEILSTHAFTVWVHSSYIWCILSSAGFRCNYSDLRLFVAFTNLDTCWKKWVQHKELQHIKFTVSCLSFVIFFHGLRVSVVCMYYVISWFKAPQSQQSGYGRHPCPPFAKKTLTVRPVTVLRYLTTTYRSTRRRISRAERVTQQYIVQRAILRKMYIYIITKSSIVPSYVSSGP